MIRTNRFKSMIVFSIALSSISTAAIADRDESGELAPWEISQSEKKQNPNSGATPEQINNITHVTAGTLKQVVVSNTDVNLITCETGDIQDKSYSTEKPMQFETNPTINSKAGYLKFLKRLTQSGEELYTKPAELYITCDGEIYSLQLMPNEISSRHIVLSAGKRKSMSQNISLFKELDLEDAAITLIDKVQFDEALPETFTVKNVIGSNDWKVIAPTVRARHSKTIHPEGVGLVVHEYLVYSHDATQLDEYQFAKLHLNTLAVRLAELTLNQRGTTKAYIVERLWR